MPLKKELSVINEESKFNESIIDETDANSTMQPQTAGEILDETIN